MTDLEKFIVALSQAWAWPLVVLLSVFLLRHAIRQLVARLRRAKYGDLVAEFGEELAKVEEAAEAIAAPPAFVQPQTSEDVIIQDLMRVHPNSAILLAWKKVEASLLALAQSMDIFEKRPAPLLRELTKKEAIDSETRALIDELRVLRNKVAHYGEDAETVTPAQALRYLTLVQRVQAKLQQPGLS